MTKQYPSKQYLNEVISNREFAEGVPPEIVIVMARQLFASMEQEPVAWVTMQKEFCDDERTVITNRVDADRYSHSCYDLTPLYAAPQLPKPAVPEENGLLRCPFCGSAARVVDNRLGFYVQCCSDNCDGIAIGPRAPELQSEQEEKSIDWEALAQAAKDKWNRRAAILNRQCVDHVDGVLPTTIKPVADLYEVTVPSGRSTTFTVDAAEAKDCADMGWKVQEYVTLERYQAVMHQGAEPDFREISNSSTKHFRENAETSTKLRHPSPIDHGYRSDCECSGCMATARIYAELAVRSPVIPDCWCRTCRPLTVTDMRFVVCPECGNKRCPRANDCRNICSGSNEPGQQGSSYPAAPQQEADNG